jgi:hypothetical protein
MKRGLPDATGRLAADVLKPAAALFCRGRQKLAADTPADAGKPP